MYTKNEYVLVKDEKNPLGYFIMLKETRGFVMIDDNNEVVTAINELLNNDAEIYESLPDFFIKYPPLTSEEKMNILRKFDNK